ncbi:hypothetical protein IU441_28085, partial [Nocardia cyriacigeorgica]|uniref:hypothetical protein n=1 Tax=Nocardia cyriacigeorgica TaxID=135487 RepID=UPI001894825A
MDSFFRSGTIWPRAVSNSFAADFASASEPNRMIAIDNDSRLRRLRFDRCVETPVKKEFRFAIGSKAAGRIPVTESLNIEP